MPSEVHLSRAQKWDLARLAVAAVVSSVFFAIPMLLVPARSADSADTRASTSPVTISEQIAVAAISEPTVTANSSQVETTGQPHANVVAIVTSTALARITRPSVATSEKTPARPVQLRARVNTPASPPNQPPTLSRRVARFIAGDGKYGPKPFPTITTSGM
jgi:hypothetical protein